MMGSSGMIGAWGFGALLLAGVVVLVVVGVRLATQRTGSHRPPPPPTGAGPSPAASQRVEPSSAREVLDRRYAAGDISTEEYQERRRALGQEP